MATPILVGYNAERGDRAPLEFGLAAAEVTGAPLIVATVHSSGAELDAAAAGVGEEQLEEGPGESLDHLADELGQQGTNVDTSTTTSTRPPRAPAGARSAAPSSG